MTRDELRERVARAILHSRGFGFYTDPMEGGQDAYDITLQAMDEADAALAAIAEAVPAIVQKAWPRAHTYGSENADMYRAQDHAVATVCAALLRALAEGPLR